jgi:methionyl-tRNA formyltransferase
MRELHPDVLALAAFGQVIPQALLDLPPLGPINVHGSLLPKYRGAAPIQRAIMAGETETGVTTMWMDATLDTGDMLLDAALPILPDDTAGTLTPRMAALGADLLVQTLDGLAKGTISRRKQDDSRATFAPAVLPEDGAIRWDETAQAICCRIRGVSPRPGAYSQIRDRRVKIWTARPMPDAGGSPSHAEPPAALEPGTVLAIQKSPAGLRVMAGGNTSVLLTETQPENGKRMSAADWARGLRLTPGEQFTQVLSNA